jgi:DNA-binding CsgD family transcriptional regulator
MSGNYFKNSLNALDFARSLVPILQQISEPLFSNTQITNFSYLKFYSDGSVVNLSTDINLIGYRFEENIKYKILFEAQLKNDDLDKPYMYFWPNQVDSQLLGALHSFDIWNGCNIYIPKNNEIEVFSFSSSTKTQDLNNFYINNFNFLTKFIIYFKSHLDIDRTTCNSKIQTDIIFPSIVLDETKIFNQTSKDFSWGAKKINIAKGIDLTHKEIECCYHLSNGLSFKSIANVLALSPRTVETHINNVKIKANCTTKDSLIGYINQKKWIFESLFVNKRYDLI